jgi:membrane protease subunit (stomatin/prohibitin family)
MSLRSFFQKQFIDVIQWTADGDERGNFAGRVKKWSAYTQAVLHPRAAMGILAGVGLTITAGVRAMRRRSSPLKSVDTAPGA